MEHTKEPWEAFPAEDCHAIAWVGKIGIFQADGIPHREWAAPEIDARRIVACVNACEGVPTAQLEWDNSMFLDMMKERNTLEQQRDELLAALRRILPHAEASDYGGPDKCGAA